MTPEARAALARCVALGCTPALVADAAAGQIDPFDLMRWVEQWARQRALACGCGEPRGVMVSKCRRCLAAEDTGRA